MQRFSGFQYLLIDAANNFGLDKLNFEDRLAWANENLDKLESLTQEADNKPLFIKATLAIRKAQQGIPSGHLVGFDATCSGIQVMSALTGCVSGAKATGLVDPNRRADAYTEVTERMNAKLKGLGLSVDVKRSQAKIALMTSFYGSKAQPIKMFGEDTPELEAFQESAAEMAPGAWELLHELVASWNPQALSHEWKLPDGYDAKVKVMVAQDTRIEVKELDNASFTYQYYVNAPAERGLANAANVVHSVDAYVLRCIQRRCNYNPEEVRRAQHVLTVERDQRDQRDPEDEPTTTQTTQTTKRNQSKTAYYQGLYAQSRMADVVILPYLDAKTVTQLTMVHIEALLGIIEKMLAHKPFAVITVHDEFKCHPNYMNDLRAHYIDIFAELADSEVLTMICNTLFNDSGKYDKKSKDLSSLIRGSNYALC